LRDEDSFSNPALARREDILGSIHLIMDRSGIRVAEDNGTVAYDEAMRVLDVQAHGGTSPSGHPYSIPMHASRSASGLPANALRGELR
jgi:hypothetical protein